MKLKYFWIILVLGTCLTLFYNPQNFERYQIIIFILLANIGWEISKLKTQSQKESKR